MVYKMLASNRHDAPEAVDGAIFPSTVNPLDVEGLERYAEKQLNGVTELTMYVTGLTVATVAVINACRKKNIALTLMHFDRDTRSYYPQTVLM